MGEGGSETGLGAKLQAALLGGELYGWILNHCYVESLTNIHDGVMGDMCNPHTL